MACGCNLWACWQSSASCPLVNQMFQVNKRSGDVDALPGQLNNQQQAWNRNDRLKMLGPKNRRTVITASLAALAGAANSG